MRNCLFFLPFYFLLLPFLGLFLLFLLTEQTDLLAWVNQPGIRRNMIVAQQLLDHRLEGRQPDHIQREWKGKQYEDKGKVLEVEPGKRLVSTFWSALAGLPDKPEHYKKVGYELAPAGEKTKLTITQDNNATQEEASEAEKNWNMVLEGIKKLVEN